MIDLHIKAKNGHIVTKFDPKNTDMGEVSLVLLRLKQIEHHLINMKFEGEFTIEKE